MTSEFETWFVAQHGARDKSGMQSSDDQRLRELIYQGKIAERVLACRELWDEKRQSALYAWCARESAK